MAAHGWRRVCPRAFTSCPFAGPKQSTSQVVVSLALHAHQGSAVFTRTIINSFRTPRRDLFFHSPQLSELRHRPVLDCAGELIFTSSLQKRVSNHHQHNQPPHTAQPSSTACCCLRLSIHRHHRVTGHANHRHPHNNMAEFVRAQIFGTCFEITSRYVPLSPTSPPVRRPWSPPNSEAIPKWNRR